MKLNEVKEIGFYRAIKDKRPDYIFEVIKNTDKEWLKENPKAILLVDGWGYEYTDDDDRRHYETFGNLMQVQNADKIEVEKMTENFVISGLAGNHLTEDKPTYKEKCIKINELCKEYRHNKPRLLCDLDKFVSRIEKLSTVHHTESEEEQ